MNGTISQRSLHQGGVRQALSSFLHYLRRYGWVYLGAVLLVFVVGGPFYWMFISSLKTETELLAQPPTLVPRAPVLTAYRTLIDTGFIKYLRNSIVVSLTTVVISTILGTCAGYSLARFDYPGRKLIGRLLLFSYLFPGVLLMVPMYILASRAGLLDSLVALPIVYVTFSAPFFSWILKAFFEGIPYDIEEAALIDGASRWQIIWRIVVPLSAPGVAAAALWTFIMSWSEYMFAVVLISSDQKMTLPIGLARWMSFQFKDWSVMNAGGVISLLPVLILFAFLGRSFIAGLTAGSTK
jgi:ABC-type glycerol-3-phosphate transport system permease component